jgi:plasmid stability protein
MSTEFQAARKREANRFTRALDLREEEDRAIFRQRVWSELNTMKVAAVWDRARELGVSPALKHREKLQREIAESMINASGV